MLGKMALSRRWRRRVSFWDWVWWLVKGFREDMLLSILRVGSVVD